MSMRPVPWPEVPAETARVAKAAFRKGPLAIRVRDELGAWCVDEAFAGVYGVVGRPGISPAQLAVVTVLQFCENLTDRQAADAVRGRLDWKYCLGLPLEDAGFDFSVLSEFRSRLAAGGQEALIFDLLLTRVRELGLVKPGGRVRTDSTQVLGAIRELNRLELAGETLRAALEALAAAAPGWLAAVMDPSWPQLYGQRIDEMRLPASKSARAGLAVRYGADGYRLLEAVHAPAAPGWLRELPAVQVLRVIWVQQYYRETRKGGEKVIRREDSEHGLPPASLRLVSPYDSDARYAEKRGRGWRGCKIHLTETCPPPDASNRATAPSLITAVATTTATVPDSAMTQPLHDQLHAAGLAPAEHVADAGYASADLLIAAQAQGITLTAPLPPATPRPGCYPASVFTIDWDHQQATCPQGQTSTTWCPHTTSRGLDSIRVAFPAATCRTCPARTQCTTATRTGRAIHLRPRPIHEAITTARATQATPGWKTRYAIRAGAESTIHQATTATGIRTARYTGLPKTRLEHHLAATALNLIRLDTWWTRGPLKHTRTTHLQHLHPTPQ